MTKKHLFASVASLPLLLGSAVSALGCDSPSRDSGNVPVSGKLVKPNEVKIIGNGTMETRTASGVTNEDMGYRVRCLKPDNIIVSFNTKGLSSGQKIQVTLDPTGKNVPDNCLDISGQDVLNVANGKAEGNYTVPLGNKTPSCLQFKMP